MVRSAAKSSSKLAGHMEPFQRVRLMIGRGNFDHVAGVDILQSWSYFRYDLDSFFLASAVAEAILLLNPPGTKITIEYKLACEVLDQLNRVELSTPKKEQTVYYALWRLLSLAGWKFDFSHCQLCGTVSTDWWYLSGKGFVCNKHPEPNLLDCTALVEFFRQAQSGQPQLAVADQSADTLRQVTQVFFQEITGRQLRSLEGYYQLHNHV